MAGARRRLYTSVAALVRKARRASECIWHWREYHPGEVSVLLIGRGAQSRVRRAVKLHLREGGCGRSLVFRKVEGRWTLVGTGRWVV